VDDPVQILSPRTWADLCLDVWAIHPRSGQRQRLALTRALAARSQLVILDEPTAHLDALSEETVVRAIDDMRREGRTVIVIAHRAAMMEAADAIIDVRSAADEEAHA